MQNTGWEQKTGRLDLVIYGKIMKYNFPEKEYFGHNLTSSSLACKKTAVSCHLGTEDLIWSQKVWFFGENKCFNFDLTQVEKYFLSQFRQKS